MAHPSETSCVFYISTYSRVADELCGLHITFSGVADRHLVSGWRRQQTATHF